MTDNTSGPQQVLVKQISTRSVFGTKADLQKLVLGDQENPHFLYRVLGEMEGYVTGKGRFKRIDKETGEATDTSWTKFAGEFVAILADGTQFISSLAFLPDYISGPFRQRLENDPDAFLTFAFDIYAKFNEQSATSYEFIALPVRDASKPSQLDTLVKKLPPMPKGGPLLITGKMTLKA